MTTTIHRAAAALFALATIAMLALAARDPSWWMLPAVAAGWYVADLASGATHMLMDYRPCRPDTGLRELFFHEGPRDTPDYLARKAAAFARLSPFERIVFDFKTHHPRPDALGRRRLLAQVGSTIAALLPVALLVDLAAALAPAPGWALAGAASALLGTAFAQFFHGALHRPDAPPLVRAMRAARLLCTPAYHQRHHDTLQCDFATISGWSNPLLNRVFVSLRRRGMLDDAGLEPG